MLWIVSRPDSSTCPQNLFSRQLQVWEVWRENPIANLPHLMAVPTGRFRYLAKLA